MSQSRIPKKMINVDCDSIRKLLDISGSIQLMTDRVRRLVAYPENQHIRWATPSKLGIIVWTDSPAWASRLRFHSAALAAQLMQLEGFDSVRHVMVKVMPPELPPSTAKQRVELSIESAEALWACADHVADANLSAALRRLAAHARADEAEI